MLALEEIPQAARERLGQIGAADLVIGLLFPGSQQALESGIRRARESVASLYTPTRAVVIHPASVASSAGPAVVVDDETLRTLPFPLPSADPSVNWSDSIRTSCDTVFAVASNLGARAVAVVVSDPDQVTPQWIYRLIRPVLELDFDLVTPCYFHARFEGLLNSAIIAPLTRALYGRRIEHPLGPDFGFSARLARHISERTPPNERPSIASFTLEAIAGGFEFSQANLGVRRYPAVDWQNQSSVLVQVLDPVFREAARRAASWQRVRGSQPVPVLGDPRGTPEVVPTESVSVSKEAVSTEPSIDTRQMLESFELACRNLQEVWSSILPPGSLLELNKLARAPLEKFHLPDALWARIVYDFAVAYHLRILNSDHLLRAMTPLFLAWVASYALEPASNEAGERLERLAVAFEQAKPYAVSRWRWPDRFIP